MLQIAFKIIDLPDDVKVHVLPLSFIDKGRIFMKLGSDLSTGSDSEKIKIDPYEVYKELVRCCVKHVEGFVVNGAQITDGEGLIKYGPESIMRPLMDELSSYLGMPEAEKKSS